MRRQLFDILGGTKCVCSSTHCWHEGECSVDFELIAQLDHIDGDGFIDQMRFNKSQWRIYQYYINNPEAAKKTLQVLCPNCNWAKRNRNNEWGWKTMIRRKTTIGAILQAQLDTYKLAIYAHQKTECPSCHKSPMCVLMQ